MFTAATGWWYERRSDARMAVLCWYLDAIVPMAYNSADEPVGGNLERLKNKLPYAKWDSESPCDRRFIVGLGFCEYEKIADVADPLQAWLLNQYPHSFGGMSFFSSYDLFSEEEKAAIQISIENGE